MCAHDDGLLGDIPESFDVVSIDPGKVNLGFRIETRYKGGKVSTVVYDRKDLRDSEEGISVSLCNYLDSHDYSNVKFVFIEKQLYFSAGATRVMEGCIMYFITNLRDNYMLPVIYEVLPSIKWKYLSDAKPKKVKKWSIDVAKLLLSSRGDVDALAKLNNSKKKDDLADVVTQSEAAMYDLGLAEYVTIV